MMAYESPVVIDLGKADELIQGGGNCCIDFEGLIGIKPDDPTIEDD